MSSFPWSSKYPFLKSGRTLSWSNFITCIRTPQVCRHGTQAQALPQSVVRRRTATSHHCEGTGEQTQNVTARWANWWFGLAKHAHCAWHLDKAEHAGQNNPCDGYPWCQPEILLSQSFQSAWREDYNSRTDRPENQNGIREKAGWSGAKRGRRTGGEKDANRLSIRRERESNIQKSRVIRCDKMAERKAVEVETGEWVVRESAWRNAENKRIRAEQDERVNWKFNKPYCGGRFCSIRKIILKRAFSNERK